MHQARKGKQWYVAMKAHVALEAEAEEGEPSLVKSQPTLAILASSEVHRPLKLPTGVAWIFAARKPAGSGAEAGELPAGPPGPREFLVNQH